MVLVVGVIPPSLAQGKGARGMFLRVWMAWASPAKFASLFRAPLRWNEGGL